MVRVWLLIFAFACAAGPRDGADTCAAAVQKFYEARGHQSAWILDGKPTPQARELIRILEKSADKGLSPADYDAGFWDTQLEPNAFDEALTTSVVRYAQDLHRGRANPGVFDTCVETAREDDVLLNLLRQLVSTADVPAALAKMEPPFAGYRRTLAVLQKYMRLAADDSGEQLPSTRSVIEPGDSYAALPRLATVLRRTGDLPGDPPEPVTGIYDGELVQAVKRFQVRHGLTVDGRIGKETWAELNVPFGDRVRQLQLTLERWRWMPRSFAQPPIVVNIPEFRLRCFDGENRVALEMNVVVGRAFRHETPMLAAQMGSVIFWPYWNVPRSIERNELIPKMQRDPEYAAKHGYEAVALQAGGSAVPINAETLRLVRAGQLRIRQTPGIDNALGGVKFLFPNPHNVYMHDTPATELFLRTRRDFSHGCIRVEKPELLAWWVLKNQQGWDAERIAHVMEAGKTVPVKLDHQIPVLIVYGAAVVLETGEVRFFRDIYGHDASLQRRLDDRRR